MIFGNKHVVFDNNPHDLWHHSTSSKHFVLKVKLTHLIINLQPKSTQLKHKIVEISIPRGQNKRKDYHQKHDRWSLIIKLSRNVVECFVSLGSVLF
jgi:hypothetical protein